MKRSASPENASAPISRTITGNRAISTLIRPEATLLR
jgi:hypothetical protein